MAKFPEAEARFLKGVFVCRRCKTKQRAPSLKISQGKISCRKCGRSVLRPARKK